MAASGAEIRARRRSTGTRSSPTARPSSNFASTDALILAAAQRGLGVLPVVHGTPAWAALNPGDPASPPKNPDDFARLLTALVTRYGPNGSLWAEHPEVPRQPIRAWQIWNEPNLTRYWNRAPWAPSYVALLKRADTRAEGRRSGREDGPGRAAERELEGDQGDLRRRRARLVRRRRAAPLHRDPEERDPDREDRAARDGAPRRREAAGLDHRALVARGAGQDDPQHGGFETTEKRPEATASRRACR